MSHSYSRDKLEESRRRKRAQQAAQQQRVNLPSANSWRGVTPSQVAKPAQQTAPKTTAPKQNKTTPKASTQTPQQNIQSAIRSGASHRGITPAQVTRNVSQPVVSLPVIHAAQERAQQVAQNDNTRRARAARAREGQRQAAQANAAALKKDRAALAANSLKWHQTSDAAERLRLEAENSAIRARRGYAYDSRTGSTFDSKGNELSFAARQIYGGRAETAKQFRDVAQTKDFVRDTSRTASQPSILDVARGVTADNPHYAIQSGQKAHSIIASLLNRSGETWTDADTKARDEARDSLQKEMQAIYQQYGATYQPRLSADETVKDLALRGADEQTLEYVRENLRLRDASDRLGQGLTAVGKRLEASIPSFVDTAKQAISNQSENKENEAFTRLEEQEKQLELQLQNMQSQDENGRVPADYQQVYDELQRVREEKNSLKVTKSVDQNRWSQRMLREANEAQANAEAGLAPAPRWVAEQAISLASNAPTMAASAVPVVGPALGSLVMGAQAAGQRAFELNEQGKSAGEALGRGTVSGIIEAATEKLPLERMAEILHSGGANAVKNILRQMGTEATEEGASYFLNYVSDLAAADPDAKFSLAELAQSAAGGAFGGLVFGTAGTVGAKLAQRNEGGIYDDTAYERDVVRSLQDADAQLRAARSMPEGAAREAAVSAAREKMSQTIADFVEQQAAESAERDAAYDGGLSWDMSAKENKGINQTLDGRLQLPGLLSDDTLVANSIRQNVGNSNTSDTNIPLSEAMQYGKTPEQAMMEANARAEGERIRQAMNRPEMREARMIAERLGAKFEAADLGAAGGRYENGTIAINPYTDNPVRQVLVHELTHHLENSGVYNDLQAAALRAFSEEQGVSADVLRQNITRLYAQKGVTLDLDGANRELTAAYCENRLFKDENSIQRLAQTDLNLFQRIRQWFSDMVVRLRGTAEQKRILEVQRLYEKAVRTVGTVQDRGAQYTFGREYDNETLAKAVQMEQEGADKDTIWNTLGVIRDTKGNWINEIDDSQMNYDEFGLHQLRKDADFRRLEELEDKANATAENFGYSPEEYAEWEALTDKYDDAVWDDKYMLRDYLKHDELFKRYPSLRIASLVFEPMRAGERGYYNRSDNSIHVNELLKSEPESTLLHEIQHFVQGRDNRPGGANPEYWRLMNESSDEWIDRNLLLSRKEKIIERMNTIEQQVGYSDFYDSLLDREEAGELTSEQVDALDREFVARYPELEALRNELYNDVYMKLKELGKGKRDPNELYRNTAGEIEARETASRRNMTAEERRQKTPDLGWDRAVFAEDAGTTAEIKYPVYTPEAIHENQRKLRDMQPVTKLTGNEFAKGDTDLMTQVLNYFDSLGNSVYSEQFGDVALTKSSWRSERRHGMTALKANTFAAVPDVIRNGVVIDYMQKHDGAVDRIVAAAPIQIGTDANYYVGVMLQRDQQSQRLYLHDVVALKKQGQKNKTQTWHQNSDVSRSSSNLDISSILRNALDGNTSVQNTFGFTPEQIAKGTVPLSEAMQYGKTPEQAVMEANARAEGERARNGYEKGETMSFKTGTKMGYPSDTVSPDGSDTPSVGNSISPNAENGNTEVKPLGNYEMYGKSREQAMRELQNKLTEKRSFLHDDDYKQVRAVQSAALRETWILARPVHEQIERFKQDHPLSSRDEQLLQAALVNDATDTFSRCDDPAAVMHRYQLQQELNRRMQPIRDYQRARGETMALNAEEMADTIAEFAKDKKIPGAYSRETMERNSYDIFGKKNRAYAERLNDDYFAPVHKAVADRTNYVNTMRQQVADLHLNKHESALVQMALEGRNDVAAEYIKNNKIKITSALQKNVADGVATFQAIYKELYESINETLLSNGMEPVRARKNYAPHFVKDKPDTMLGRIRFALGLGKDSNLALPTDIAGITDDFSPGKKWFGNLLRREGELTDYDAVAGFDRYIETAGDVIFLTDSVQQLRSLEDALRYRLSDEGTREKVNQIRNDRNLNALERHQKIDEAYNSNQDNIQKLYNQKKQGMGGYVSNLHEYINNLAGKKARADRGWEELIGRQMYTVAKNVEGRVAANMIAANPGSWITNFIPITQVSGEVSTANIIRAMRDTVKSAVKDDGFTDGSVFLTNREGTQLLDRTLTRKISDIAGMPMEAIDHFASNVVTRAKYLQNIQDGMGLQEAFDNADAFAANLIADRSKGAQPTAFNSVNPIRKVFTMFQLEVNNQLSYLFKDLPRAKQSVPKLAWAYTKVFTGAYLFNAIFHLLTGRDSAFDPIGMIADAFGFDPFDDDEDKDKKKSGVDIALDLGKNAAEQIPFVGGLIGGGRVPISAAFPDFGKLIEEYENGYDKKRIALDAAKSAANSAAYLLLPFGGGALKRTAEGAATVYAGGSYSLDKNGEKILQFPQYGQSPRDWAQAMLFGKSSLKTAQDWADNGYDSLNAKETKVFDTLRERMSWHGEDNSEAVYAAIKAMRVLDADAQERYPSNYKDFAATRKRQMLMQNNDLSADQKDFLDRELISGGQSGTYTSQDAFVISQTVRESRQKAANEALKHGITAEMFADWDSVLEMLSEAQNDDGSKTYTTNTALGEVLKEIEANTGMTAGEKEALSDYLLTTAMSESDRDKWNDEVKGKVNASDYVRFKSDLSAYQKEYKGTGADNAANIAEILRGYTNLTDEQRGVLMNTYSETAKSNPFHVSDLEKKLADNSFYKDLNDSGRETLRTYCNEYEQAVAGGKELSGWKAKAYMAKEAGIAPETYALFQTALKACDYDENGSYKSAEIEAAVKLMPGLNDKQRGYLWQAAKGGKTSKNNPWGATNVTKYTGSGTGSAVNPVEGGAISSGFGPRSSPTAGASSTHKAIDIAAAAGTPVKAAMAGKVIEVTKGYNSGYGNTVSVDHGNGIITKYHHMQDGSIDGVSVGQEVAAGTQIGKVGSTGISTGPHLDFQVVKDGNFVDPRKYIPGYGSGNDYFYSGSASAGAIASGRAAESAGSSKKSSGSSGSSGGTSLSGLKNLKKLPTFK